MFLNSRTECFIEAAKCLNFTRAAEKLYMSQPALSKNIAALEEECGMKLFYRDVRHNCVKLTEAGAVMLCELQKTENVFDKILDKAKKAEEGQEGHLVIGLAFGQIINSTTKTVLRNISENYPLLEIEKISGGYRDLRMWLEDGTADVVVTYEEEAGLVKDVMYEEVQRVQLGFVVPVDYPLAKKEKILVKDLEGYSFLIVDARESFIFAEKFRELCMLEGFVPNEIPARDLNHLNMMAEVGQGICIAREDTMITRSPNVKFYPSDELGMATLVAAWNRYNLNPIITFYHRMYEELYAEEKNSHNHRL